MLYSTAAGGDTLLGYSQAPLQVFRYINSSHCALWAKPIERLINFHTQTGGAANKHKQTICF